MPNCESPRCGCARHSATRVVSFLPSRFLTPFPAGASALLLSRDQALATAVAAPAFGGLSVVIDVAGGNPTRHAGTRGARCMLCRGVPCLRGNEKGTLLPTEESQPRDDSKPMVDGYHDWASGSRRWDAMPDETRSSDPLNCTAEGQTTLVMTRLEMAEERWEKSCSRSSSHHHHQHPLPCAHLSSHFRHEQMVGMNLTSDR